MNTEGIIFLSLGILCLSIPIIIALIKKESTYSIFSLFSILFFFLFGVLNWPDPRINDVKEGKAVCIEEKNVGLNPNGDTIYNYSTYHIEWLPEWKYRRKQN